VAKENDSKFTPQSAERKVRAACKVDGKKITVPSRGIGLGVQSAIDYLQNYCGAIVAYEHSTPNNVIPVELRGTIK
jgi:hypothetical protein